MSRFSCTVSVMRRAVLYFALLALGCSESKTPKPRAEPSYQALVELDAWSRVARGDDPFIDDAAAAPACVLPGFRVEDDQHWLEIDTGACNWVTLTASPSYAVEEGQQLKLRVSHYDLDAAAPAEAVLELRFDDCEVWSKTIAIPSPANVIEEELASPCTLSEGAAVFFHVNNHGQNTYQLQAIEVLR